MSSAPARSSSRRATTSGWHALNSTRPISITAEQFAEALSGYEAAYKRLLPHRDLEGIAVALHNMAVCLISLDDFDRAFEMYRQAHSFFQTHDMPRLVFQVHYNLANLYYLRGDYELANRKLRATRENCSADDPYHAALCDLDQSEVYLELNLSEEAVRFAERAAEQFEKMGMGYELARAWNNLGIGLGQQRETRARWRLSSTPGVSLKRRAIKPGNRS